MMSRWNCMKLAIALSVLFFLPCKIRQKIITDVIDSVKSAAIEKGNK